VYIIALWTAESQFINRLEETLRLIGGEDRSLIRGGTLYQPNDFIKSYHVCIKWPILLLGFSIKGGFSRLKKRAFEMATIRLLFIIIMKAH
jgi:hypothetical protein